MRVRRWAYHIGYWYRPSVLRGLLGLQCIEYTLVRCDPEKEFLDRQAPDAIDPH